MKLECLITRSSNNVRHLFERNKRNTEYGGFFFSPDRAIYRNVIRRDCFPYLVRVSRVLSRRSDTVNRRGCVQIVGFVREEGAGK